MYLTTDPKKDDDPVWIIPALMLEASSGLLNVIAYTWQSRHARTLLLNREPILKIDEPSRLGSGRIIDAHVTLGGVDIIEVLGTQFISRLVTEREVRMLEQE